MYRLIALMALAATVCSAAHAAPGEDRVLTGWGVDEKNLETFLPQARAAGFDALITGNTNPEALAKIVQAAAPHNIRIISYITPMGTIGSLWKKAYPDRPVPWQVMTPAEDAAFNFITAGKNRYLIPYQFGGEPVLTNEVLSNPAACFANVEARDLLKPVIDGIASVPGLWGLGFDGFGYQNYRRCHCERCNALLAEFVKKHPEMKPEEAEVVFFRDMLVDYTNFLADYARSKRPDIKTSIHIWPVFAPEPLYGNRLNVDECGQTAAWYMYWPQEKIAEYSRIIVGDAKKYHSRQEGVGMIGYYDSPGQFPEKNPERVDMELRTMIENGVRHVQVCSSIHVVRNEAIAGVFRKYFGE